MPNFDNDSVGLIQLNTSSESLGRCEWRMPERDGRRCLAGATHKERNKRYCDAHPGESSGDPLIDYLRAKRRRFDRLNS